MTTLEAWTAANDEAEKAGRAVLDALLEDLQSLSARAAAAKKEAKRCSSLSTEADKLESAIRTALSALHPRTVEAGAGESTDEDHMERVRKAREEAA